MAGSALAPAAKCRNLRRGSVIAISCEVGRPLRKQKAPREPDAEAFRNCSPAAAKVAAFDFTEAGMFRWQLCD
jgi:hypothetical protein